MNNGKRKGKTLMLLGALLVVGALLLTFYNNYTEKNAGLNSQLALQKLEIPATPEESVPDYILNPEMDLPIKTVDGNDYVGTVEIPALKIELPVISQWSYGNFKIAPCIYEGTPYKNNLIIAAHNYKSHFAYLRNLEAGNAVTFTDIDGNQFDYRVMYVEILDNNAVEEMSAGDWDLTLFTCTYGGATRVTVRCEAIDK